MGCFSGPIPKDQAVVQVMFLVEVVESWVR